MTTLFAAARIAAASSGVALRTGRVSCLPATAVCSWPKAPKSTFENDRFIAFDMFTERIKPEAPSNAPAMINSLLSSTNPIAARGNDNHHTEQKWNADDQREELRLFRVCYQHTRDNNRHTQKSEVDDVLSLIRDGPLWQDFLQFSRGHQAASERQRSEDDLE